MSMRLRGFSRFEVILALIAAAILTYLGIPFYRNILQDSEAFVCESNLKAIKASLDIYVLEHETLPGDLSEIPLPILKRGYALVMKKQGRWRTEMAYFIVHFKERGFAYAGLLNELSQEKPGILICPSAERKERSYALWKGLASGGLMYPGLSAQRYRNIPEGQLLVGDCREETFDSAWDLAERHRRYFYNHKKTFYAQGIVKADVSTEYEGKKISGIICEVAKGSLYSKGARRLMVFETPKDSQSGN